MFNNNLSESNSTNINPKIIKAIKDVSLFFKDPLTNAINPNAIPINILFEKPKILTHNTTIFGSLFLPKIMMIKKNSGKNNRDGKKGIESELIPINAYLNKIPVNKFQNANHMVQLITWV